MPEALLLVRHPVNKNLFQFRWRISKFHKINEHVLADFVQNLHETVHAILVSFILISMNMDDRTTGKNGL